MIVGLEKSDQILVLNTILGQRLSVRDTENLVKRIKNKTAPKAKKAEFKSFRPELLKLKSKLDKFGKISIKDRKISIEFNEILQISEFLKRIG